jgi:hypothetical protein
MAKKEEAPLQGVVEVKPMELASGAVPDYLAGTAGKGNENVHQDDLAIPRLNIVQTNSPEVMADDAKFISGVKAGDLFDTLTRKQLDAPLMWVDVHYRKVFAVAVDRKKDAAGGIRAQFDIKSDAEKYAAADPDSAKLEVIDTPIHAGILFTLDGKLIGPTLIYMPKTKAKVSRQINGELDKIPAARYARVWRISTVLERNKNNQPYYNFKAENAGWTPKEVFDIADKFYETVHSAVIIVRDVDDTGESDLASKI